jgi:hypothetical protein
LKRLLHILTILTLSCQAQQDTVNIPLDEDLVDRYGPFLVKISTPAGITQINGVSTLSRALIANDTLEYWLEVIDTAKGVTVFDSAVGIRFHVSLQMRGYGLWLSQDPDFGPHWEIYDQRFRRMRDLPLVITRIIEIPVLRARPAVKREVDDGPSSITVGSVTYVDEDGDGVIEIK